MVKTGQDKISTVPTRYTTTTKRNRKHASTDETASLSSKTSSSSCGWSDEGLERFNQFVDMLMAKRPHRKPLELKYLKDWVKASQKEGATNKRKREPKAAGSIQARNTLFAGAEDVPVDLLENPYGTFDVDQVVNSASI